ncbi:predicted protein [Histoplasma capsulatum var. duboisii H88]|uniref:Predicted protein n=1 Tax=Ajellomyces capsulatus (strain H88) TaxID=544711 RepID=F0UDD7_AJEC8|nr:predicted protein [Histoplasma capsulatum var. duboisii H88]
MYSLSFLDWESNGGGGMPMAMLPSEGFRAQRQPFGVIPRRYLYSAADWLGAHRIFGLALHDWQRVVPLHSILGGRYLSQGCWPANGVQEGKGQDGGNSQRTLPTYYVQRSWYLPADS